MENSAQGPVSPVLGRVGEICFGIYGINQHSRLMQGQAFTLFLIVLAACEVAVALAMLIAIFRNFRTIEVSEVSELKS